MNMPAVIEHQRVALTAADVRANVNLVQEVMRAVMKQDVHYGIIPGCKQPSLYKAGSEVLLSTFRIAVGLRVEDLSGEDEIRYRVYATGTHQASGIVVGEGVGECSSNETKYKWRRAYRREWEATPENRRRVQYGWNNDKKEEYEILQVRTEIADVANTILKMAKKRAQIDLTLTATAASDCFTQDIEDLPDGLDNLDGEQPPRRPVEQPRARSAASGRKAAEDPPASEGQIAFIRKKLEGANIKEAACLEHFKLEKLEGVKTSVANDIIKWIASPAGEAQP